jgi:SAM-dependent methyltransferase
LRALADPQGLAFDALAEDYDLGRAGWPAAMLHGVRGESVLDLAAGTGKLTRLLVEHYPDVTAVEPLAGMRAVLERNVPAAKTVAGSAERIPLDDASVDAVFVAEAFHWFDSVLAVREIARVLRPGGTAVVCFNDWLSHIEPEPPEQLKALLRETWAQLPPPGGPKVQSGAWKDGFGGAPFTPLEETSFDHEWTTDRSGIAAYFVSTSSMGQLSADERSALRAKLVELLPDVSYRVPLAARVFRARRT